MTDENESVKFWLDALDGFPVAAKQMFGCYCLYCDGVAVGWISNGKLSLREVGLNYIPADIARPKKGDRVQEYVIPEKYAGDEWLKTAVIDTAKKRKTK